jgi:predicted SAM-dependent methyltransferase
MIKLHLGCGKRNFGPDWVHIDGINLPHIESHNVIDLPYKMETVDLIYASHLLEYFDRQDAHSVLDNWRSKLKVGGILRLAVPNWEAMVKLYYDKKYVLSDLLGPLYGKWSIDGDFVYHKTVYDYYELRKVLEDAGFKTVREWDWRTVDHGKFDDHSQAYLPHMDKENGTLISLNLEAIK